MSCSATGKVHHRAKKWLMMNTNNWWGKGGPGTALIQLAILRNQLECLLACRAKLPVLITAHAKTVLSLLPCPCLCLDPPTATSTLWLCVRRCLVCTRLQLKSQFPEVMKAKGMSPPAKHPLMLGDKQDMLERRRQELERWVWRLISTADIARSSALKSFLDFDKALQRAQQQRCAHVALLNPQCCSSGAGCLLRMSVAKGRKMEGRGGGEFNCKTMHLQQPRTPWGACLPQALHTAAAPAARAATSPSDRAATAAGGLALPPGGPSMSAASSEAGDVDDARSELSAASGTPSGSLASGAGMQQGGGSGGGAGPGRAYAQPTGFGGLPGDGMVGSACRCSVNC